MGLNERIRFLFLVILIAGLSIGFAIVINHVEDNTDQIAKLEHQHFNEQRALGVALAKANARQDSELRSQRQGEYRICVRQMVTRAAINLDTKHDEPRLRLYDCAPNLVGRPPVLLSLAQTRALKRRVARRDPTLP